MTLNLFKTLYLGSELTNEEYENIPNYRFELHWHVLYKNLEAGCIMGGMVIGPLVGLIRGRSLAAVKAASIKGGKIGLGLLLPLSPVMTEAVIRKASEDAIYDRSFRIRHNQGQLRCDRYATYGGIAGAGATIATGAGLFPGLILGVGLGTISAAVQTKMMSEKK